jgi:hypothetical protein
MPSRRAGGGCALAALLDELAGRGRQVTIVDHPDGGVPGRMTVDAIIQIDGQKWAVDHCLLSRPPDLPPALAAAEAALQSRLDAVVNTYRCGLIVSYLPQANNRHSKQQITDYYDQVVKLGEQAARTNDYATGEDRFASASPFPSHPPVAHLLPETDTTGRGPLGQIQAGLKDTLEKKLAGQLKKAKDHGLRVALLIDQVPRPGSRNSTVMSAAPTNIARVVQHILSAHPGVVDQVWLHPAIIPAFYPIPRVHLLIA